MVFKKYFDKVTCSKINFIHYVKKKVLASLKAQKNLNSIGDGSSHKDSNTVESLIILKKTFQLKFTLHRSDIAAWADTL